MKKTALIILFSSLPIFLFANKVDILNQPLDHTGFNTRMDSTSEFPTRVVNTWNTSLIPMGNTTKVDKITNLLIPNGRQDNVKTDKLPDLSIGIGTGINNYTGLIGFSVKLKIVDKFSLFGGAGIGGWGFKSSIGLKYSLRSDGGLSYGVSYSHCSGIADLKTNEENSNGFKQDLTINCLPVSNIDIIIDYSWKLGKRNSFYFNFGYSIPTQGDRWEVKEGIKLSDSAIEVYRMLQPGGIIVGCGFTFGIGPVN